MGFNVTQLVNDVLKVEIVGLTAENVEYDNTTSGLTAENLQAAVDEVVEKKANIVVGGDFDNMDLKEVAEKLDEDKQDVVVDSGWIDVSLKNGAVLVEGSVMKIRKIGKVVYLYGNINVSGKTIDEVLSIPSGYFPNIAQRFIVNKGSSPYDNRLLVLNQYGANSLYATDTEVVINVSWTTDA